MSINIQYNFFVIVFPAIIIFLYGIFLIIICSLTVSLYMYDVDNLILVSL